MITLIGTPPNIVIAEFRNDALGAPYSMFDFAPVGLACAIVGVLFVATVGWRLIPQNSGDDNGNAMKELFDFGEYIAEVKVPESSDIINKRVRDLDDEVEETGATIVGLVRRGKRMPGMARLEDIRADYMLVVEAHPEAIDRLVGALKLEYVRPSGEESSTLGTEDLSLSEVVVPEGSRIEGRSAISLGLLRRRDVTLLGVSRQGRRFRQQVRKLEIRAGDVLLLLGPTDRLPEVTTWLGCFPLAERGLQVVQRQNAILTVGIFGTAVIAASFGVVDLAVALAAAVALLVALRVVQLRNLYESVEWPVIVLLGSMIPIGHALETSGSTGLIASAILNLSAGLTPVMILTVLMIVTMTLSDVMNNVATAVIAAPIALDIAERLGVNPDPFLMAVAVASSCAFLTPIGHRNNTLIMGPGGYHFGDYWRMGLPLEILVIATGVPMILWVWPL
jgi:di/tricarboxylate transporter